MADVSDVKPGDLKQITGSLEGLSCKSLPASRHFFWIIMWGAADLLSQLAS